MFKVNAIVVLFAVLLTACGYQLRGAVDLPASMQKVYLQNASSPLREQFGTSIRASSGRMVDSVGQAGVVINVLTERFDRRVLSLSSTGKANEFELLYALDFEVLNSKGGVMLKRQTIELSREYFNDQQAIIAKTNEEEVIRTEMYQQAVRSIINQTRARLTNG